MPHDRQLQSDILAELLDSTQVFSRRVVVTAVSGNVLLAGQVESFAEKYAAASLVASIPGVDSVTDDLEVGLEFAPDSRFLLAAKRVMTDSPANGPPSKVPMRNSLTASLVDGLLTVTGEIDWRQGRSRVKEGDSGSSGHEAASNISDDILRMLPRCFFSSSRAHR